MNFKALLKHNDILLAMAIMVIIGMLLLPMPAFLLDGLLVINLALAVTILMVTLYTKEALDYSTFPTILLLSTLFRLGLNVSSTRLILVNGDAGSVIHAFGSFVIGGNYLVGILIFIILVVINFIVITHGASRVAEVAARFALDAMPGKQLSIDADLNAGMINEEQARSRRLKVQQEADFHGTMDGASKFVKGDAIAAIIITVVNIIGGLIVGIFQQGLPIQDALSKFTILTVGEGLVSQMPALIISTATGLLVTRISKADVMLSAEISSQMLQDPKVLGIVGILLGLLGLVPGLPPLPFLAIAGLLIGSSYLVNQRRKKVAGEVKQKESQEAALYSRKSTSSQEAILGLLQVETLELEMGYRLVPLLEAEQGGDLLDRIAQIRRQMALELGFILPSVRVRDNLQLAPMHYQIKLRGVVITSGTLRPDMVMAMTTDPTVDYKTVLDGLDATEPAFGLPALWIQSTQKEQAESLGCTVVSPSAVVATHLTEIIRRYSSEILSRNDVEKLLENVKQKSETLVTDLIPEQITTPELMVILQQLLKERVSIRDLPSILESLSYHTRVKKDIDYLAEQCRMALSRQICKQYEDAESGELPVVTLAADIEEKLVEAITPDGQLLALSPVLTQDLLDNINRTIEKVLLSEGVQPVILCHSRVRLALKRLIERMLSQIAVLSYNEIGPSVKAKAVGNVELSYTSASLLGTG